MRTLVLAGAVIVVVLATYGRADACSIDPPAEYKQAPVDGDTTPPGAVQVVAKVREPKSRSQLGFAISNCDDIGSISLTVTGSDDRALPAALGYRIAIVKGEDRVMWRPDPERAYAPHEGGFSIPFRGDDAFDVTLEVRAVDPNGNVGSPTQIMAQVPAAFPWRIIVLIAAPCLLVLVIVAIVRRLRRRR